MPLRYRRSRRSKRLRPSFRKSYRKLRRYKRRSTRYSTASRRTKRLRTSARRYGNKAAAKALRVPIGGFKKREIIRLTDQNTWICSYDTVDIYGNPILRPDGVTPITGPDHSHLDSALGTDPSVSVTDDGLGKIAQYNFRLNDLRNAYNQGVLVKNQQGTPEEYNSWHEPSIANGRNVLKKIPLSHYRANNFKGYTVIGSDWWFRITNNEPQANHKIWYAYRLVRARPATANQEYMIPDGVPSQTTLNDIRDTGRWTTGVVAAANQDKMAQRTFKISFKSTSFFGYDEGKPESTNVSGRFKSPNSSTDSDAENTCTSPPDIAYLQLILGPINVQDWTDPNSPTFGQQDEKFVMSKVLVEQRATWYVSCHDPYPIQTVSQTGIGTPTIP